MDKRQMHKTIKNYFDLHSNKHTTYSKLWDKAKKGLDRNTTLNVYIEKKEDTIVKCSNQ